MENQMSTNEIISKYGIQIDNSGQGHNWKDANEDNCPASIAEEIAAEIIDGGKDSVDDYVASNGCHYRW